MELVISRQLRYVLNRISLLLKIWLLESHRGKEHSTDNLRNIPQTT